MFAVRHFALSVFAASLFAAPVWAQATAGKSMTVQGVGEGQDDKAALAAALEDAVTQVLSTLADAATLKKNRDVINDKVMKKSGDFALRQEIVKSEKTKAGLVRVRVKATIDKAAIAALIGISEADGETKAATEGNKVGNYGEKVLEFCRAQKGKEIGTGECTDLAAEALKAAGAKQLGSFKDFPREGDYVWGKSVGLWLIKGGKAKDDLSEGMTIEPGDIIQYRDATFEYTSDGREVRITADHHTAVVKSVKKEGKELVVMHQNIQGKVGVQETTVRLRDLRDGWLRFYRPIGR